jgi:CBS domain-containing protein
MTRPAVAVTPDTGFAAVVTALTASGRGILPVVRPDGTVAGVIAASDLLTAYADAQAGRSADAGILAHDLMTAPAVTVADTTGIGEAVALLTEKELHHLPVVDRDGRLVGLLTPHDLLDALREDDEAIRTLALTLALTPGSGVAPGSLHVRCERGHVTLTGRTRTRGDAASLCLQIARIEGLAGVTERLTWDVDDDTDAADGRPAP